MRGRGSQRWGIVAASIALASLLSLGGFSLLKLPDKMLIAELETNWHINVPKGLVVVEHYSEKSFHGDGYRFKALRAAEGTPLTGTFFDINEMSKETLSPDEQILVREVSDLFHPQQTPNFQQGRLLKKSTTPRGQPLSSESLLCLHNEGSDTFFTYEKLV